MSDNPAFLNAVADAVYKFFQNMHEDGVEANFQELASRFLWHQVLDEYHTVDFEDLMFALPEWTLALKLQVDRYNEAWTARFALSHRKSANWVAPSDDVVVVNQAGLTPTLMAIDQMRNAFNKAVLNAGSSVIPTNIKLWVGECLWPLDAPKLVISNE